MILNVTRVKNCIRKAFVDTSSLLVYLNVFYFAV